MSYVAYKFRMSPNKKTVEQLEWMLERCRELYNAALQERRDAWKMSKKSLSYYDQANQLPYIKESREEYQEIGSHVLQDVLKRVDKAFQAFFRRIKEGQTPGFPRFKGKYRYNSLTFPDSAGWKYAPGWLTISKFGTIRIKQHRPLEGESKTVTIERDGNHWYVIFVCECIASEPLPQSYEEIGIDLGIKVFAALSNGEMIDNPRYYRTSEEKLVRLQQELSRKKKGSERYKKCVARLKAAHKKLVDRYQVIALEDLSQSNMSRRPKPKREESGTYLPNHAAQKAGLNKSIFDASWGQFVSMISVKAAKAGRVVVFVDPKGTSQQCSGCGEKVPKDLSVRIHECPHCGLLVDRDTNAAVNILERAYTQMGWTIPAS
jgi:putative transposase